MVNVALLVKDTTPGSQERSTDATGMALSLPNPIRLRNQKAARTTLHRCFFLVPVEPASKTLFLVCRQTSPLGSLRDGACKSRVSAREELPPTMKPSPACAPREGAPSLRRRRNDSLPLSLRRAFRAPPSTRCATTVCAAARRVQPH